MTTTTIFADIDDAGVSSGGGVDTGTDGYIGRVAPSSNYEQFLRFDTSAVGTDDISSATFSMATKADGSTQDFTAQLRLYDWSSGGVTAADYRSQAQFAALTILATYNTASGITVNVYQNFTSTNLVDNINKTGSTYVMVGSDRFASLGTSSISSDEYVNWYSADASGTTFDPKLVIEHAAPSGHPTSKRWGGIPFSATGTKGRW